MERQRLPKPPMLTDRDEMLLALIAAGHSNSEIAERMHKDLFQVKHYISRLMKKVGQHRRAQLAVFAVYARQFSPGKHATR